MIIAFQLVTQGVGRVHVLAFMCVCGCVCMCMSACVHACADL